MRILSQNTQAILIDVQERLTPHIHEHERICDNIIKLIKGLQILDVPMIANEQYPKGLGSTISPIKELLTDTPFEKITFSSCDDEPTLTALKASNRPYVVVFGIETHVCVLQTVMDLLENGFVPVVVADAVGSRHELDKKIALKRMAQAGAILVSVEMILFELCRSAKNLAFKEISALVK